VFLLALAAWLFDQSKRGARITAASMTGVTVYHSQPTR
jgi:hypothetical protein